MDIMLPPLEQQVSPPPWLAIRNNVDVPSLIARALMQSPDANLDGIVTQLRDWGVQMSGIIVSMWLMRWKEHSAVKKSEVSRESHRQIGKSPAVALYRKCEQQLCTRGWPWSPRWQHYYCSVLLTEDQAIAIDDFFRNATTP